MNRSTDGLAFIVGHRSAFCIKGVGQREADTCQPFGSMGIGHDLASRQCDTHENWCVLRA